MIHVRALEKSYQTGSTPLPVLRGIDMDIAPGESVAIVGASGSGKSTLLNVLGLLDDFDSGTYTLAGQNARGLTDARAATMRNQLLGFVFQSFHLLADKDAIENVALPLTYRNTSRRDRRRKAIEMLERVGLGDRLDHRPNQLSGGQKQRVAIARALVTEPGVLLADEPTGALDSTTSDEVLSLLEDVVAEGKTLILVTHDADVARRMQRTIRLHDGVIVSDRKGG
ncbi:MAG: macrolide ABC transporter ATP-binding protein [Deltaproteobacteria bacterium]|nr:macrolide ABC transporter ATP-binding protein [Deltaproteobacteria bacterium]HCH64842.1 macrolide ABC transporter ATP-binding protein [Deltaproteobacteria bacterium]